MQKQIKTGNIDLNHTKPEVHEYATYLTLAKLGKKLKILPPSPEYKVLISDGLNLANLKHFSRFVSISYLIKIYSASSSSQMSRLS